MADELQLIDFHVITARNSINKLLAVFKLKNRFGSIKFLFLVKLTLKINFITKTLQFKEYFFTESRKLKLNFNGNIIS